MNTIGYIRQIKCVTRNTSRHYRRVIWENCVSSATAARVSSARSGEGEGVGAAAELQADPCTMCARPLSYGGVDNGLIKEHNE